MPAGASVAQMSRRHRAGAAAGSLSEWLVFSGQKAAATLRIERSEFGLGGAVGAPPHPVEDVLLGAGLQWPIGQGMAPEWNTREMLPAAGSNPLNHSDQSPASQAKVMLALRASEHEKAAEGRALRRAVLPPLSPILCRYRCRLHHTIPGDTEIPRDSVSR